MSELISGKEALIALANGECVQKRSSQWVDDRWMEITSIEPFNLNCFLSGVNRNGENIVFRIKPKTITLNSIEVPAPFEPKEGERFYYATASTVCGWSYEFSYDQNKHMRIYGAWRTEDEIKQVVAALRKIFVINNQ